MKIIIIQITSYWFILVIQLINLILQVTLNLTFWNREHVWPKSHGDFDAGDPFEVPAYTDAHNLKPVDHSMNTLRGEKDFENGGEVVFNGSSLTDCFSTNSTFEPRNEVKGDIARMIFYMDLRYEGGSGEPNLVVVEGLTTYPNPQIGSLSTLLEWHEQDPPDAFEKEEMMLFSNGKETEIHLLIILNL